MPPAAERARSLGLPDHKRANTPCDKPAKPGSRTTSLPLRFSGSGHPWTEYAYGHWLRLQPTRPGVAGAQLSVVGRGPAQSRPSRFSIRNAVPRTSKSTGSASE